MEHNQESDETLMAICAEAPGCFEIDPESGGPMENCVYSKLIQLGYSSTSSARAGGERWRFYKLSLPLGLPVRRGRVVDKMHPECLKLVSIIQKCQLKQSILTSENAIREEGKGAFSLSSIHREIGDSGRKSPECAPDARNPNGCLWKRIADQVARNYLEWIPWGGGS